MKPVSLQGRAAESLSMYALKRIAAYAIDVAVFWLPMTMLINLGEAPLVDVEDLRPVGLTETQKNWRKYHRELARKNWR
jgi:hypothetical protein